MQLNTIILAKFEKKITIMLRAHTKEIRNTIINTIKFLSKHILLQVETLSKVY